MICSPLTTDAHAAGWNSEDDKKPGWWDEMIGPGKAIDTNRYFVISSNMLGGCKGTTGPASIDPATGKEYGSTFPKITIEDMVHVQRLLVEHLGIDILEAVVGGSMGGMQALQWSVSYPKQLRKCMCIAAAGSLSAQALGFEIIGRSIIVGDPGFQGGDYYGSSGPDNGLGYARMIGHLTYLSAISMHEKFGRNQRPNFDAKNFETGFEVESYLKHQGKQFVQRFDANSYLHITYAMDSFDLVSRYGSLDNAFRDSDSEFLLVGLSSDWLFPTEQTHELAKVLLNHKKVVSVAELDSPYGHDAFLLEVEHLSRVIQGFLEKPAYVPANVAVKSHLHSKSFQPDEESARDMDALARLIEPGSHILDVGCGDGSFIDAMFRERKVTGVGIDFDLGHVVDCLRKNVPVVQGDVDHGLSLFGDQVFDYAVLNRTLQEVKRPRLVLRETLRVARKAVVAFPNFGHIGNRLSLVFTGAMPITRALPHSWHDTPNIHLFSLNDFQDLCARENIVIEELICFPGTIASRLLLGLGFKNAGAEFVVARITKK